MKKKWYKWIIFLTLTLSVVWCLMITFKSPYLGIYVKLDASQEWVIKELDQAGAGANLQVGDRVIRVDGMSPDLSPQIQKWRTVEQAREVVVARDGTEMTLVMEDSHIPIYHMVPLGVGIISLVMALLLAVKMRRSPSARMLALFFMICGIIWLSFGASVRGDALGKFMIANGMMALQVVFLHFLLVFLQEKCHVVLKRGILKYLYAIVVAGVGIRTLYFVPPLAYKAYLLHNPVTLSFFAIVFFINIGLLTYLYIKHRQEKSYLSTIIKSVWVCLFISFLPFICFTVLPKVLAGHQIVTSVYSSVFILLFPLSFAYLIASEQLYDIGNVIRRFVLAVALSLIPCSVFTGFYAFVFPGDIDARHLLFVFVSSVVLVASVLYTAEYFTTKLEPVMFPRKFALQSALKKISKRLESISSFLELKDLLVADIVDTLEVAGGAIVFRYPDTIETVAHGSIDTEEVEQLILSGSLSDHSSYTCVEVNRHEEYVSYLILTRKKSNTLLTREEVQWLRLITTYLAVSLENLYLIRKLTLRLEQLASQLPNEQAAQDIQWFRKLMYELQEAERIRIATDLHDTTMQDLFFLKRKFVSLLDKVVMDPADRSHAAHIINFVELINANLRQNCFELNPFLLSEIGLIPTMRNWLEQEAANSPFHITFRAESGDLIEVEELITKKHIFRIVQEWINNAKKHSQASHVTLTLSASGQVLCLTYEDDGVGFDYQESGHKNQGRYGIGMEQMRGRVLFLNGQWEVTASRGSGVKYRIAVPLKKAASL
ncbi:ATP-binding protein [Paenibacillus filicis]|uniref:ATP-binding protein n=1 Tax=Paenibacillus filicis TaxID=669464 RepID=A0ABU9DTJ4_9BACL